MKGFVFDLDGVITDTAKYHYAAWKQLAAEVEILIDENINEQLKGISRKESLKIILEYGKKLDQFTEMELVDLMERKNRYYIKLLESLTPSDILPGVKDFLLKANNNQLPCVVASASKNAPFILEKLGLTDKFMAVVDPATLAKGKPDPEIFVKAARLIGLLPEETIGFEDAQAGIDGMKSCGMYAIGVGTQNNLRGADRLINNLTELDIKELIAL